MTAKWLGLGFGVLALVLVAAVFGIGWYYSGLIEDGALLVKHDPPEYVVEVVALEDGRVTLRFPTEEELGKEPRVMGIEWPDGYARVGGNLDVNDNEAVREYELLEGTLAVGDLVNFDKYAYPGDPLLAHGMDFEDVRFASPMGEFAAWQVDGPDDTWVILVHGKGASRAEALRMLPVIYDAGLPSLSITYRNDDGAPEDPSGYYQYGLTEWNDLEAAAQYALAQGAGDLIIVGYSMGGAIVTNFLYQSSLVDRVAGVILDSPMLDLGATVDLGGQNRNLPGFLTTVAKIISGFRYNIDWAALDYLSHVEEITVPVLLFHGDADETVPVETSGTLAASRPDLVTYVLFEDTPHVGGWNVDSETYEAAAREFIDRVAR
jgi:pimeloyl-ACP methyl ester carboxylesterase